MFINNINSCKIVNLLSASLQSKTFCCFTCIEVLINKTTTNTNFFFFFHDLKRDDKIICNLQFNSLQNDSLRKETKVAKSCQKKPGVFTCNRTNIIAIKIKTSCSQCCPINVTAVLVLNKIKATSDKTVFLILHNKKCIPSIVFCFKTKMKRICVR